MDPEALPEDLLAIVEACRSTLVELRINCGDEERTDLKPINLPNPRVLEFLPSGVEGQTMSILRAPALKALRGATSNLLLLPFMNVQTLKLNCAVLYVADEHGEDKSSFSWFNATNQR